MCHSRPRESSATIVWFRDNLRLSDNAALVSAAEHGPVVAVYIYDEYKESVFPTGAASRWWLEQALADLDRDLRSRGASLALRRGDPSRVLRDLCSETGACAVAWQKSYEPMVRARDARLAADLNRDGIACAIHPGYLLFDPDDIRTTTGTWFKVFTPFSKACFAAPPPDDPLPAPERLKIVAGVASDRLEDWHLTPRTAPPLRKSWTGKLARSWRVGEQAARSRLQVFLKKELRSYKSMRDRPDQDGTSRLSPYLHFGNISPRQVWHAIHAATAEDAFFLPTSSSASPQDHAHRLSSVAAATKGGHRPLFANAHAFLQELLWREFSWHLLAHVPTLPSEPFSSSFREFPWSLNEELNGKRHAENLRAWQRGETGYPIVDAGMRQLWETGWMHNRVRMIVASFLVKDLLIHWREGAAWFWDTLVDADLANNSASWQWVAGCGADAAPYFRIFNPGLQSRRFDPEGHYVRRFVPELARLDVPHIHEPWNAPSHELAAAGVILGETYPFPVIDHGVARQAALTAFARMNAESRR